MTKKPTQLTAREAAYSLAIDFLRATFERGDFGSFDFTSSQKKRVRYQIGQLHNKLLDQSGLDGLAIDAQSAMQGENRE